MTTLSSFQKAMWCGAVMTVLLFVGFAAVLPPGGNYARLLGRLTSMGVLPALVTGWITGRGKHPKGWWTVTGL
jgi:hypothetical protein